MAPASKLIFSVGFVAILAASRLVLLALGLAPDPVVIAENWQHIDLTLLASDPVGSLWALHSQPPLWNMVLALAVAIAGPDPVAATVAVIGFNMILTAGAGLLLMAILRGLGAAPWLAMIVAAAAMCAPSVVYFEFMAFYAHLTFFLVMLFVWALTHVRRDGASWPVVVALASLTLLSWTWAIFHPLFVAASAMLLLAWWRGRAAIKPPMLAFAAVAAAIALLPTVKNVVVHGTPSASTWIGLNFAQTVPGGQTGELAACDFANAQRDASRAPASPDLHPLLTQATANGDYPNMHHANMIATSRHCLTLAMEAVIANPIGWLSGRAEALAGSHQVLPSQYDVDPQGWSRINLAGAALEQTGAVGRIGMILWHIALVWFAIHAARYGSRMHLQLLVLLAYFTLASHALNGGEQGRMRYTMAPVYMFLLAGAGVHIIRAARRPSPAAAYPSPP